MAIIAHNNGVVVQIEEKIPSSEVYPQLTVVENKRWRVFINSGNPIFSKLAQVVIDTGLDLPSKVVIGTLKQLQQFESIDLYVQYLDSYSYPGHVTVGEDGKLTTLDTMTMNDSYHRIWYYTSQRLPSNVKDVNSITMNWVNSATEAFVKDQIESGFEDIYVTMKNAGFIKDYKVYSFETYPPENYTLEIGSDKPHDLPWR